LSHFSRRTYDSVYARNGDERSIIGTQRWPCTLTRAYSHKQQPRMRDVFVIFPHERDWIRESIFDFNTSCPCPLKSRAQRLRSLNRPQGI